MTIYFCFFVGFLLLRASLLYILVIVMRMSYIVHKCAILTICINIAYMNYHILQLIIAASIAAVIAMGAFITFKTSKN